MRARRRRRGPTTTRAARPRSTASPCTASRSRGRAVGRLRRAHRSRRAPRPARDRDRAAGVDRQAGPGRARVDRRDRADATPTSSRSIRSCTTRRSPAFPASRHARSCIPPRTTNPILRLPIYRARVRRGRRPRVLERSGAPRSSSSASRSRRSPRSSSASVSTRAPATADAARARARPRRPPVPAVPRPGRRRQGRAAARRVLRALQGPPRRTVAARLRGPGRATSPPRTPTSSIAGAVDEAVKWGLLRGALALVSPERVRVVLDRADGGVVGRHARARQQPLRGHARPRPPLGRRARVRQLRRARGRARPAHRVTRAARRARAGPDRRTSTATTAGPT